MPKLFVLSIEGNSLRKISRKLYKRRFQAIISSNVGSVVEFSPATREARVRFPDVAFYFSKVQIVVAFCSRISSCIMVSCVVDVVIVVVVLPAVLGMEKNISSPIE